MNSKLCLVAGLPQSRKVSSRMPVCTAATLYWLLILSVDVQLLQSPHLNTSIRHSRVEPRPILQLQLRMRSIGYQLKRASMVLCRQVEERADLSSAAEQVCCLVQALLLHYNHSYAHATGKHLHADPHPLPPLLLICLGQGEA